MSGKYYPECVCCTQEYGFDMIYTIACFLNGHQRLWIDDEED